MKRILWALAPLSLFIAAGCGGGGSGPDTTAPVLQRISVTQVAVGAPVHVEVDVTDSGGIASVVFIATDVGGIQTRWVPAKGAGTTYFADLSGIVRVMVEVTDRAGNKTVSLDTAVPPPPPF